MPASAAKLAAALELPPPYALVALREGGDAFAHACGTAEEGGAGTFVWVRRFDLVEFAVVLEPEEPLRSARRALFAGMNALADAIATRSPPEKAIAFDWPDALRFDGALLGGGRLGWPAGAAEDAVPNWLVFAGMLVASKARFGDPGLTPHSTALDEEGFESADHAAIVEAFARYLLKAFDAWSERGFQAVAEAYLARLTRMGEGIRGIDGNGDLIFSHKGRIGERVPLVSALARPSWLDPATGMPRL